MLLLLPIVARFLLIYELYGLIMLIGLQIDVNGGNAAPLYKYLKSVKGGFLGDGIKWNFSKFLVDKEGRVVDRYAPTTSPLSIEVTILRITKTCIKLYARWILGKQIVVISFQLRMLATTIFMHQLHFYMVLVVLLNVLFLFFVCGDVVIYINLTLIRLFVQKDIKKLLEK